MKNSPRKPRSDQIKNGIQPPSSLLGIPYNFCFIKFYVKCTVWQGEVYKPHQTSPGLDLFKHTRKPFPVHNIQMFQNSLKLVQQLGFLWRIHTHTRSTHTHAHTLIELYMLDLDIFYPYTHLQLNTAKLGSSLKLDQAKKITLRNKLKCLSMTSRFFKSLAQYLWVRPVANVIKLFTAVTYACFQ